MSDLQLQHFRVNLSDLCIRTVKWFLMHSSLQPILQLNHRLFALLPVQLSKGSHNGVLGKDILEFPSHLMLSPGYFSAGTSQVLRVCISMQGLGLGF